MREKASAVYNIGRFLRENIFLFLNIVDNFARIALLLASPDIVWTSIHRNIYSACYPLLTLC